MRTTILAMIVICLSTANATAGPFEGSDAYKSHMEFLGYEITEKDKALQAKHGKYLNVWVKAYQKGVLLIGYFGRNKEHKDDEAGFHKMINDLNKGATAARYYEDKDGDLAIEAWYPGSYEKVRFGIFLDSFHRTKTQLSNEKRLETHVK